MISDSKLIKIMQTDLKQLEMHQKAVSEKSNELSDQIANHNRMIRKLCEERELYDREWNELHKRIKIAKAALKYAETLQEEEP